jgi:hypothetical protein
LTFEEPMTEVDGQIDLVGPLDLVEVLVLINIDCNELVAYFRGMLSGVDEAELLVVDGFSKLRLLV